MKRNYLGKRKVFGLGFRFAKGCSICRALYVAVEIIKDTNEIIVKIGGDKLT